METELLTILPNLSIGVVCIGALVYISNKFLIHLDQRARQHETSMSERESALRKVESEVRTTILTQLSKNTEVMNDTTKTLERVVTALDRRA